MTGCIVFFAQLDGLNPLNPTAPVTRTTGLVFKDVLVIIATGLGLGLCLLLWARHYVKGRKRRRHHSHSRQSVSPTQPAAAGLEEEQEEAEETTHRRSRRRRKRRREHRPRNPTLAETGGLPTTKTEPSSHPPL